MLSDPYDGIDSEAVDVTFCVGGNPVPFHHSEPYEYL